jgi:anti-sigma28 factor (negative regulator of flagellin synthesis)
MRIDERNLSGNQAAQTGKTGQTQEIGKRAGLGKQGAGAAMGDDRVELSTLSGSVARALEADAQQRQARLEKLSTDYAAGRHQVDARTISKAIVADLLSKSSSPTA